MLVVYKLKPFLMGFSHPVSDSVLHTFNIIAYTNFQGNAVLSSLNTSRQLQERSEGGRVTIRFYILDFQEGVTWSREFLVDEVVI